MKNKGHLVGCATAMAIIVFAAHVQAAVTNLSPYSRTFAPVAFSGSPPATVFKIIQGANNLIGVVGTNLVQTNVISGMEREQVSWSHSTATGAWQCVLSNYPSNAINFTNELYDNLGWIKGTRQAYGDWGAYLWLLQNTLDFNSSTSTVWISPSGITNNITRVMVGTLGDYAAASNYVATWPDFDAAYPGANMSTDVICKADLNAFYKLEEHYILPANCGDTDDDGIPGYDDGFNKDGAPSPDDVSSNDVFDLFRLYLPPCPNVTNAYVRIDYDASLPSSSGSGSLRIWNKQGYLPRNGNSITSGGNFIGAGDYSALALGFSTTGRIVSLYLEGVNSTNVNIQVSFSTNGTDWMGIDLVNASILKVDIATDINNDGTIDAADEPIEESGIGEVVRVDDIDDRPGGEDDLQYMQVKIEPTLTRGVVWFTYDTAKVKIWPTLAQTPGTEITSGSEASPNWNLGAGGTVPNHVYIEGLATTAQGASTNVVLHVKVGGTECTDTILFTVTDQVGHYAYFAGVRDYLTEYRGPGAPHFKLFHQVIDAPGGPTSGLLAGKDYCLVAVQKDKAKMGVCDAYAYGLSKIDDVLGPFGDRYIIVNGTFQWPVLGGPPYTWASAVGRCLQNYTAIVHCRDMLSSDKKPEFKAWFGMSGTLALTAFNYGTPTGTSSSGPYCEPVVPTPPYTSTSLYSAIGGTVRILPTYDGLTIKNILDGVKTEHDWYKRQSAYIGLASPDEVIFVMTTYDASVEDYVPVIATDVLISSLQASGADVLFGLDGGSSVALWHRDRLGGTTLPVATKGDKHVPWSAEWLVCNRIVTYLLISVGP